MSHIRATLRYDFCERGRNGEGGRSVSRLVFLTAKATITLERYYYYWRPEQNWDRSVVSRSGKSNLSLVVGLVRPGIAPKWGSVDCGAFHVELLRVDLWIANA